MKSTPNQMEKKKSRIACLQKYGLSFFFIVLAPLVQMTRLTMGRIYAERKGQRQGGIKLKHEDILSTGCDSQRPLHHFLIVFVATLGRDRFYVGLLRK